MKAFFSIGLALLILTALTGCSEPPAPPEIQLVLDQEQDLWRAGANLHAPTSYEHFLVALKTARQGYTAELARPRWFRDYKAISSNLQVILAQGEQVRREIEESKAEQARELLGRSSRISERLHALRDLIKAVKDSRLNSGRLSRIEILLEEAGKLAANDQPEHALGRLEDAELLLDKTVAVIRPILSQYIDAGQISRWKSLVDEVVTESRRRDSYAIVVNKLGRQLVLYKKGKVMASYTVGLGFKPIGDKLYAGDQATPEGRYQVVSKLPNSKYYRALLLNYPNAEDQRRFAEAKLKGKVPQNARIGGLIEIHGGGKESATLGCIGLDNDKILELFNRIEVGTPVVIVGALKSDNLVRIALGQLE